MTSSPLRVRTAVVLALAVVLGACGGDGPTLASPTVVSANTAVPEELAVADTDLLSVAPAPSAPAEVLPATESLGGPEVEEVANSEVQPTESLAIPVVAFVVSPDAAVLDVAIGTPADAALLRLDLVLGEPDSDTGWYVGCPTNGVGDNERLVQWGDLNVYFERSGGQDELVAWGFDLRKQTEPESLPSLDTLYLPGGAALGDPIEEVAQNAGLLVLSMPEFGVSSVGVAGYEILAGDEPNATTWGAFVPAIPRCL